MFIQLSCMACIVACIGDFAVMFYLGTFYPGYNQLKNTMSSLGASVSPVSDQISAWWILVGVLFVFFGMGFKQVFKSYGKGANVAALLIMLYGIGEGIGSGLFKADHIGNTLTKTGIVHDIFGGIGVTAIVILPQVIKRMISQKEYPRLYKMSTIVFMVSIITVFLFSLRFSNNENNLLNEYQGLWQRLMMLNNYIYLLTLAIVMLNKNSSGANNSMDS